MSGIAAADLVFYALAALALAAASASALLPQRRRASAASQVAAVAVAAIFAWLGAGGVAMLLGIVASADAAMLRRSDARSSSSDAPSLSGDATVPKGRRVVPAALLVLAFFVVAAHALLMTRWPLLAAATRSSAAGSGGAMLVPVVSFVHCLLVALALFVVGCFALLTRREAWGLRIGVDTLVVSFAIGAVAVSRYVSAAQEGQALAGLVVVSTALATMTLRWLGEGSAGSRLAHENLAGISSATTMVLAVVTAALFAGAW